uniref:Uncharacterized protein n=1 Tax=Aegilops tauschii subsp. strangulata TaxID=200361 RepID=A0A453PLR9_AEGTS
MGLGIAGSLTGAAEGDGAGVEPGGDAGRRLDVEHDERAVGAEAQAVERPAQRLHALLAAVNRHHHAGQVGGGHGCLPLRSACLATPPRSGQLRSVECERWLIACCLLPSCPFLCFFTGLKKPSRRQLRV